MDNLLFAMWPSKKIVESATVIPRATSQFYRPVCAGISVHFAVECLSTLPWNACPLCRGISVQFGLEYAGIVLLSGSVAFARGFGPGCGDSGPGWMGHPGGGRGYLSAEEKAGARLDALKRSLKLTADQEKPWNEFSTAVENQAKEMEKMRDEMRNSARTAPERLEFASKVAKQREQGFEVISKSLKNLYDSLTADQRQMLDRRGPWMRG